MGVKTVADDSQQKNYMDAAKQLVKTEALCDWKVRKAVADHFEFVACGRPGQLCSTGPKWQLGHVRCSKHFKTTKR